MTHRKVVTPDARNHGESPHSLEMSYSLLAKDMQFLIKHVGEEKVSFLGEGQPWTRLKRLTCLAHSQFATFLYRPQHGRQGRDDPGPDAAAADREAHLRGLHPHQHPSQLGQVFSDNKECQKCCPIFYTKMLLPTRRWETLVKACRQLSQVEGQLRATRGVYRSILAEKVLENALGFFLHTTFITPCPNPRCSAPSFPTPVTAACSWQTCWPPRTSHRAAAAASRPPPPAEEPARTIRMRAAAAKEANPGCGGSTSTPSCTARACQRRKYSTTESTFFFTIAVKSSSAKTGKFFPHKSGNSNYSNTHGWISGRSIWNIYVSSFFFTMLPFKVGPTPPHPNSFKSYSLTNFRLSFLLQVSHLYRCHLRRPLALYRRGELQVHEEGARAGDQEVRAQKNGTMSETSEKLRSFFLFSFPQAVSQF